jgi:hypothetical protein
MDMDSSSYLWVSDNGSTERKALKNQGIRVVSGYFLF